MCFCCYSVYNEQCNTRISSQCLWIMHPCVFWFFGSTPSWCVYSGLCVHWNGSHLCSLRILLHFSFVILGTISGAVLFYTKNYEKILKDVLTELFWLDWNLYKELLCFTFLYIFCSNILFCKRHIGKKNKQYFLYCYFLLLFLFSSQLPYNVYIIEMVNVSSSLFLIF